MRGLTAIIDISPPDGRSVFHSVLPTQAGAVRPPQATPLAGFAAKFIRCVYRRGKSHAATFSRLDLLSPDSCVRSAFYEKRHSADEVVNANVVDNHRRASVKLPRAVYLALRRVKQVKRQLVFPSRHNTMSPYSWVQ